MSDAGSPTVPRRELGTLLRALRAQREWTVDYVAGRLLISASKVSRLETGQRGASPRDVRDLCDLYEVDEDLRQHLMTLAKEGKQRAWWQPFALPYSTYVDLESDATSIRDFGLGLMPGLLQTRDYARAVLQATVPYRRPDVIEQLVEGRMVRQQRVLSGRNPPDFRAILEISVLHRLVGGRSVMQAQLQRLVEASEMSHVTLRVLPYEAGALPVANNKFIILSPASPELSDIVFVEGLTGDLYLEHKVDVDTYRVAFLALEGLAATPEATRAIITSMIKSDR